MKTTIKSFVVAALAAVGLGVLPTTAEEVSQTFADMGFENASVIGIIDLGDVKISFDKGSVDTPPKYYDAGKSIRCYAGNTFTVSATNESTILTSITLKFGASDGSNAISSDNGNYDNGTGIWQAVTDTSSVKFSIGGTGSVGNRRLAGITVIYTPPKSVTQIELERIFDVENTATMVKPEYDADGNLTGHTVILGQNHGPVAFSNDFGAVTIDLNGWTIKGADGADGTTTTAGGNGVAAITIAGECGAAMGETSIMVKNDICVQLWENGPHFAQCNIGATKPQEYGYYFWWGNTVGYVRDAFNSGWDAQDGSVSGFWFTEENCQTFGKSIEALYDDGNGYIDANSEDGKLKPEYDAATFHWGAPWRMPTKAELDALVENCTTKWTDDWEGTGKAGRIVSGKGDYESKSIFLPAAGYGVNNAFDHPDLYYGYCGYYWSSTPYSENTGAAWLLKFQSDAFGEVYSYRFRGQPVRAVRGSEEVRPTSGLAAALIGGNGGNGNPAGKGAFAVVDATGAEVPVSDPLGLVKKGEDGVGTKGLCLFFDGESDVQEPAETLVGPSNWFSEPTADEVSTGGLSSVTWSATSKGSPIPLGEVAWFENNKLNVHVDFSDAAQQSLVFTPPATYDGEQVFTVSLNFLAAYDSVDDLPPVGNSKAGIALVKHEDGGVCFAFVSKLDTVRAWSVSAPVLEARVEEPVGVRVMRKSDGKLVYEYKNSSAYGQIGVGGWCPRR